jgi:hypothetical protein
VKNIFFLILRIKEKGIGEDYKMHPELIAIMISP